jgi:hypothetical protein
MQLHQIENNNDLFLNETVLNKFWSKASILNEQQISYSRKLLENNVKGLNPHQRTIIEGIYCEFIPLIEATLTQDQILQIFQQVEQGSTQAGTNRTVLGKTIDYTKKANEIINNIGRYLQNTQPVQQADQKFQNLKNDLSQKYPNLEKTLSSWGVWMKSNPGKSAFVIGLLTALASVGTGPMGGAIVGQVLRGASELVKGEKLSTAVGKGAKTAALGYAAGAAANALGGLVGGAAKVISDNLFPGAQRLNLTLKATGYPYQNFSVVGKPEDIARIADFWDRQIVNGNLPYDVTLGALKTYLKPLSDPSYLADLTRNKEIRDTISAMAQNTIKGLEAAGAIAQGAASGSGMGPAMDPTAAKMGSSKQSVPTQPKPQDKYMVGQRMASSQQTPLSESQIYLIIGKIVEKHNLNEGIMDKLKGAAQSAASKATNFVATKGKNLTTKITADKLLQVWNKAGKPTDSDELAKILVNAGVSDNIVSSVIQSVAGATNQQTGTTNVPFTSGTSGYGQQPVSYGSTFSAYGSGAEPADTPTGRLTKSGTSQSGTSQLGTVQPGTSQVNLSTNPPRPFADEPYKNIKQDVQTKENEKRLARSIAISLDDISNRELLQDLLTKIQSKLV